MENSSDRKEKRIAIIGTAPTFRSTPWDDPTLEVWCLNDFWVLKQGRADRWFDLHPLDKMHFRDPAKKKVFASDIPPGFFVRPQGHVEWLRAQGPGPIWLTTEPHTRAERFYRAAGWQEVGLTSTGEIHFELHR